jgi:PAS domain S-box-containing protein
MGALILREQTSERLALRAKQQEAVAELGQRALSGMPLQELMNEAAVVVAAVLNNEFCKILETLPGGEQMLLRAGVGWRVGLIGKELVEAGPNSQAGYTLLSREPVVMEDLRTESRFRGSSILREHGVASGLSCVIQGAGEPFGVLGTHSSRRRVYSQDDVNFIRSVANVLGEAIWRQRNEERLRTTEERQRVAMDAGQLGAWEWDVQANTVQWSEGLELIHGIAPGSFAGTFEAYLSDVYPDDRDDVVEQIQASMETGAHEVEYRIVRPDGAVRWVHGKGKLLRGTDGHPLKMVGVCTDVTARKVREERRALMNELSAALASSLDDEEMLDQVCRIVVPALADSCSIERPIHGGSWERIAATYADRTKSVAAERLATYSTNGRAGHPVNTVLQTGLPILIEKVTEQVLVGMAEDDEHLRLIKEMRPRSAMVLPLLGRNETFGVMILATSSSGRAYNAEDLAFGDELARRIGLSVENARLYLEATRMQQDLQEANDYKDEFLGLVSHELRTPITTIYGGARLLRTRGATLDDDTKAEVIADIEGETERLHRLVEDLLVLSRMEIGSGANTEPLLVQRVIERVLGDFRRRHPKRVLECVVPADIRPVLGDATYVEQVVRNLLSNADKYSPQSEPIGATIEGRDQRVIVSVLDRGPGIDEDELGRVFEPFHRGAATQRTKGLGLGLTVCKRLVEAQDGEIWAERRDGGGLCMSFSLPVCPEEVHP